VKRSPYTDGPVVIVSKEIAFAFPFGIAYLAGYLRQQGEDVRVLFRPEHPKYFRQFVREIIALKPLLVGFGSLYPDLYPVRDLIKIFREEQNNIPLIIGGQMVSPTPEFAVKITDADFGVIGEGEIIFHNLVTALRNGIDLTNIKGLAIRYGDTVHTTEPGEYIKDLSNLPPIPYDLFPSEKWLNVGRFYTQVPQPQWHYNDKVVSIHGGRGCPFSCNFCYHSNAARYRKIPDMMEEANTLLHLYDANMIYFGDDLVLASPARAVELTEAIRRLNSPVAYSVSCRFDILNRMSDDLLLEMKRTGCRIMGLGIESGSQRILDIMHKRVRVEHIREGLRRLKEVGIMPTVSIMVGQLTETKEDVEKSMALMIESVRQDRFIQYAFTITTPFPGSELYDIALKRGLLKNDLDFFDRFDPVKQFSEIAVNFSEMNDGEIRHYRKQLEVVFRRESGRQKGWFVKAIEFIRKVLGMLDSHLRMTLFPVLPSNRIGRVFFKSYFRVYDAVQVGLDNLRLKLLRIT
jgi:anaerobic magnesium-protoporphyrin IX monomethyl ester cyclase